MKLGHAVSGAFILVVAGGLFSFCLFRHPAKEVQPSATIPAEPIAAAATNVQVAANIPPVGQEKPKVKTRFSEFRDDEKSEFAANFEKRFKPALYKWCNAFDGHVPFAPETVTPEKIVERVGRNDSYYEYVFVVDGITLGIQDKNGSAQVDYLNDPKQTRKMAALPNGAGAPISDIPVNRQEITQMVATDSGTQFPPYEIRMTPSGFSGGLNGGELVHIGGDPQNGASWKFDMVFGADGRLAYYLRGQQ